MKYNIYKNDKLIGGSTHLENALKQFRELIQNDNTNIYSMEVEQDYIKTINCDKCVFRTLENCTKRTENCEYFIQKR